MAAKKRYYLIAFTNGYDSEHLATFGKIKAKSPEKALSKFQRGLGNTPHIRMYRAYWRQYVAIPK